MAKKRDVFLAALLDLAALIVTRYGKTIVVWSGTALKSKWHKWFGSRDILILGDKQAGKTSLLNLMRLGKPYEGDDDKKEPPNPTVAAVIVNAKSSKWSDKSLHVQKDVGGDKTFRSLWKELISTVRPEGIVYMIDGRGDEPALRTAMQEMHDDVLVNCNGDSGSRLLVLHVFLNFADAWKNNEIEARRKARIVTDAFDTMIAGHSRYADLQFEVSPSSLNPAASSWPLAEAALTKFGGAFAGKSANAGGPG